MMHHAEAARDANMLFLIAGAIVNVAVAWGSFLWSPKPWTIYTDEITRKILVDFKAQELTTHQLRWPASVPGEWPSTPARAEIEKTIGLTELTAWGPVQQSDTIEWEFQHVYEVGIPMRSLYSNRHNMANPWFPLGRDFWQPQTWSDGIVIPSMFVANDPERRVTFPVLPIWPGFAINTIFYAAMLWVAFVVPGMVRRRIRRRRGRCPACAYPVGTSEVCTECGAALRSPLG